MSANKLITMKRLFVIPLLLMTFLGFSQKFTLEGVYVSNYRSKALAKEFNHYQVYKLNAQTINSISRSTKDDLFVQLILGDEYSWPTYLYKNDLRQEGYKIQVATENGVQTFNKGTAQTYLGNLSGDLKNFTSFTFDENYMVGMIKSGKERFFIEPVSRFDPKESEQYYVVYRTSEIIVPKDKKSGPSPSLFEESKEFQRQRLPKENQMPPPNCRQAEIALAADYSMLSQYNDDIYELETHLLTILNLVQTNYDDEFDSYIQFKVPTMFVSSCVDCDPWDASTESFSLLNSFSEWGLNGGFGTDDFDLASLWTDRVLADSIVGLAWIKEMCGDLKYNLLSDYTTNTALLKVLQTHEIGHNFGLSHTPPSDSTFMSPEIIDTDEWHIFSTLVMNLNTIRFSSQQNCLESCDALMAPSGEFSANNTAGCFPLIVNFNDESNGEVISKKWVFEGGTPAVSFDDNPAVTYNGLGTFDVMLIVQNTGGSDTIMKSNFIDIGSAPLTDFTIDYTPGNTEATFTPSSNQTGVSYFWNFGDGTVTNQIAPNHNFQEEGLYQVTLISSNDCASDTLTKELVVAAFPSAAFKINDSDGCAPINVQFDNTSRGFMSTYNWTFEGGEPSTSTEANPNIVYSEPGDYQVTLVVTNPAGSDTLMETSLINITDFPTADFTIDTTLGSTSVGIVDASIDADSIAWFFDGTLNEVSSPFSIDFRESGFHEIMQIAIGECGPDTSAQMVELFAPPTPSFEVAGTVGCAPITIQVMDNSEAYKSSYLWTTFGAEQNMSTETEPSFTYLEGGFFDISLTLTNLGGVVTLVEEDIVEVLDVPTAGFEANYSFGDSAVVFRDTSDFGNEYFWDFGDGTTSDEAIVRHIYDVDGSYDVSLIVSNECGRDTINQTISVLFTPSAAFNFDDGDGCLPHTVQYNSLIGSTFGTILWVFEGGNPRESLEDNPVVTYENAGVYDVSLYVLTTTGTDSLVLKDAIEIAPIPEPTFDFEANRNVIQFINNTNFGNTYSWDFGDGNSSTEEEPAHSYSNPGTYEVTLIAENGCDTASITNMVTVEALRPRAGFSVNVTEGCVPFQVTFIDESFNAENYMWSFPGGNPESSSDPSPVIIYENAGNYSVELLVSNGAGNALIEKLNIIEVLDAPQANFSFNNEGMIFDFSNLSTGADSYLWNFGDGTGSEEENPVHEYIDTKGFQVTLIAFNECGSDTSSIMVQPGTVSTNEPSWSPNISIYPNPNPGTFYISGQDILSDEVKMELFDIAGKLVSASIIPTLNGTFNLEIGEARLESGIYLLKLSDSTGAMLRRVSVLKNR